MALFKPAEWSLTQRAVALVMTNPFDPNWRDQELALLGMTDRAVPEAIAWRPGAQLWGPQSVYNEEFDRRIAELVERLRRRLAGGACAGASEWEQYELLAIYRLYCDYGRRMDRWVGAAVQGGPRSGDEQPPDVKTLWAQFRHAHEHLLRFGGHVYPLKYQPEHVFACFFLFRRAFYQIFFNIIGTSAPIAGLRSQVWESIVTHDLVGWMQGLYRRMNDIPTLITGPSGTGKERVAETIGRSLYIPFRGGDFADFRKAFNPVNLSALPPLLIESELFGSAKGSFTGAVHTRKGRLEECPENGAVFLDEIGELNQEIQVKLLRVLQMRRFERVGESAARAFSGKVIAATNRELAAEMRAGRFREDFYYRLCADQIATPSLRAQLKDRPEDLPLLVGYVCRTVVGEDRAGELAPKVVGWIEQHLPDYAWPGNFRELEQCVRSYTIRKAYRPVQPAPPSADDGPPRPAGDPAAACEMLADAVLKWRVNYREIRRRLFTLVCRGAPTLKEAAARLGVDSRTVQACVKATASRPADGCER
jgi:DNA-binding NtrC family response regulator